MTIKKAAGVCLFMLICGQNVRGQIQYGLHGAFGEHQRLMVSDSVARLLWQPFDGTTILRQTGSGLLWGGLAGGAAFGIGILANPSGSSGLEALGFPIYLGLGVSSIGLVYGVQSAGDAAGGNGNVVGTILGTIAGGGVAVLSAVYFPDTESGRVMKVVGVAVGSLGGPILGYHFSASSVYETKSEAEKVSFLLTPRFDRRQRGIQVSVSF